MSPEDLERVKAAHSRALNLSRVDREEFLCSEFVGEPDLQTEVRKLLQWHDEAGEFLNTPLGNRILEPLARDFKVQRIGPWELVRELGHGGSATVFLARRADDLFEKRVAIKLLNRLSHSAEVFERFRREIQILARLEHPYVVRLLEAGTTGEAIAYIVTDFVDGRRIDEFAATLALPEKLRLFCKVCEGVSFAHKNSVVHRDLKPSNILVTADGTPKLLDFGIARLLDRDSQLTETGLERMTLRYASPEQVKREKPITPASDIYSLGVILYELLAGRSPYAGADHELASRILSDDPLPLPGIPAALDAIVRKALQKDAADRFSSVDLLRDDLGRFLEGAPILSATVGRSSRVRDLVGRRRMAVAVGSVAVGLSLGVGQYLQRGGQNQRRAISLGDHEGSPLALGFSPDGSRLYYIAGDEFFDYADLFVKDLASGRTSQLTKDGVFKRWPRVSPTGDRIAFLKKVTDDTLMLSVLATATAVERTLFTGRITHVDWSLDGRSLVVAHRSEGTVWPHLRGLDVQSGEWWEITAPPREGRGDHYPAVAPDGKTLAFVRQELRDSADLFLVQVDSTLRPVGSPRRLTSRRLRVALPHWTPDGRFIYFAGGTLGSFRLYRVATDGRSEPSEIREAGDSVEALAVARSQGDIAVAKLRTESNIWQLEVDKPGGKVVRTRKLPLPYGTDGGGVLSPNGEKIAFTSRHSGELQIWVSDWRGSGAHRVTSYASPDIISPIWLPDSNGFVASVQSRTHGIRNVVHKLNPVSEKELIVVNGFASSFSADGNWLYFAPFGRDVDLYKYRMTTGEIRRVTHGERGIFGIESPDGRWLYFAKPETDRGLWRMSVNSGPEEQVVPALARRTLFAVSSDSVYYLRRDARSIVLRRKRFTDGSDVELYRTDALPDWSFSLAPGARGYFLCQQDAAISEVHVLSPEHVVW